MDGEIPNERKRTGKKVAPLLLHVFASKYPDCYGMNRTPRELQGDRRYSKSAGLFDIPGSVRAMKFFVKDESFIPKSVVFLRDYDGGKFTADLIAGITVGLVALPLAGDPVGHARNNGRGRQLKRREL